MIEEENRPKRKDKKGVVLASLSLLAGLAVTATIFVLTNKQSPSPTTSIPQSPKELNNSSIPFNTPTLYPSTDNLAQTITFPRSGGIRRLSGGKHASEAKVAEAFTKGIPLNEGETWVIDHSVTRRTSIH